MQTFGDPEAPPDKLRCQPLVFKRVVTECQSHDIHDRAVCQLVIAMHEKPRPIVRYVSGMPCSNCIWQGSRVLPIRTLWPPLQISEIDDRAEDVSTSVGISNVEELDVSPANRLRRVVDGDILREVALKALVPLPSAEWCRCGGRILTFA